MDNLGANNLQDWWDWRRNKDEHDREMDKAIAEHDKEIAIIQERQSIQSANEAARHAKTPTVTISLISMGITILFFILNLIIAGTKP